MQQSLMDALFRGDGFVHAGRMSGSAYSNWRVISGPRAYPGMPTEEHSSKQIRASRKAHNTKVTKQASWEPHGARPDFAAAPASIGHYCAIPKLGALKESDLPRSLLLTGFPGVG